MLNVWARRSGVTFLNGALIYGCLFSLEGCVPEVGEATPSPASEEMNLRRDSVGAFRITVDARAEKPVAVAQILDHLPGLRLQNTDPQSSTNTVMNSVSLTGPGVWDDATQTLRANVTITHTDNTKGDFDEVQLVVTDLSDPTVTFETSDNGSAGVGAAMAFTDIQSPASTSKCTSSTASRKATHALVIKDTDPSTTFSFTVDVRAVQGTASFGLRPDCDEDGFNTEINQDAGNDCNDSNGSIHSGCSCASGATQCTSAGAQCVQPAGTSSTCSGGCICDLDGTGGTDINVTCSQSCNVVCDDAQDSNDSGGIACQSECKNTDVTCNLACTNASDGSCATECKNNSVCNLSCRDNSQSCLVLDCKDGASCSTLCTGDNAACGITSCKGGASCAVVCSGDFETCGISSCKGGATCSVKCGPGVDPGGECSLGCSGDATCSMDCSDVPVADRAATCDLGCTGGRRKTETSAGSGIYTCQ